MQQVSVKVGTATAKRETLMHRFRFSQPWIALTLVAIVMMAAAPSFAFACYCGTPAAQTSCHHAVDEHCSASHHAHCHGDMNDDDADAAPAATAPSATIAPPQGAQTDAAVRIVRASHTHDCCTCQVNDAAPFAPTESPTLLSKLVPAGATLPAPAFSLALPQQATLGCIEYQVGPPSNPVNPALPSRAPPAI